MEAPSVRWYNGWLLALNAFVSLNAGGLGSRGGVRCLPDELAVMCLRHHQGGKLYDLIDLDSHVNQL